MSFPDDVLSLCRERFGLGEIQAEFPPEGPVVPREHVLALSAALKDELGFAFFVVCTAAHYPADANGPDRVRVIYRVRRIRPAGKGDSRGSTEAFAFQVIVPTGERTPSLARIWAGADWEEREQYDLVGVVFEGHPDLRRIMMPEDWPGHPLRRDYAIETAHFPWR